MVSGNRSQLVSVARVVEADYVAVEVALETDIASVEQAELIELQTVVKQGTEEADVVAKTVRRYAETAEESSHSVGSSHFRAM